jgi:hypothetical protein
VKAARRRAVVFVLAALSGVVVYYGVRIADDLGDTDLHGVAHVGSDTCAPCHRDEHRTFARTHHGRMTREATEETVLGDFDGAELRYGGVVARMDRGPGGAFRMTFDGPGFVRREVTVARTVGSHRYQQYLAREDDLYVRLPVAWSPADQRWFHMNEAFLTPDPPPPEVGATISREDYDRHVVRWNDNCVFCHNVAPNPGRMGERFDTRVAELGVACEACHGPGQRHVNARRDPVRSLALDLAADDPTLVSPKDLSPARAADVCGRCHGQRKTDDIEAFLTEGDPFVPGDDLADYSTPLQRDTPMDGQRGVFAPRFWSDGTPRLTAYAYQGYLMSPCTAATGEPGFSCTTCHGMHEGDPAGQLRPESLGDGACIDCHEALGQDDALEAHTHHPAASSGARCTSCHMPKIVYGLVGARISHRIEIPDPSSAARADRPDACTLCHVDETRAWAISQEGSVGAERRQRDAGGGPSATRSGDGAGSAPSSPPVEPPEVLRALFGGDPIERAVAADALGQPGRAAAPETQPTRLGALLDVMANDPYPAVRRIAWRSAQALADAPSAPFARFVATDDAERRASVIAQIEASLPEGAVVRPDPLWVAPLRAAAAEVAIDIGE